MILCHLNDFVYQIFVHIRDELGHHISDYLPRVHRLDRPRHNMFHLIIFVLSINYQIPIIGWHRIFVKMGAYPCAPSCNTFVLIVDEVNGSSLSHTFLEVECSDHGSAPKSILVNHLELEFALQLEIGPPENCIFCFINENRVWVFVFFCGQITQRHQTELARSHFPNICNWQFCEDGVVSEWILYSILAVLSLPLALKLEGEGFDFDLLLHDGFVPKHHRMGVSSLHVVFIVPITWIILFDRVDCSRLLLIRIRTKRVLKVSESVNVAVMLPPLSHTDQFGVRVHINFIAVNWIMSVGKRKFQEFICFQIPLQNHIPVDIQPNDFPIWSYDIRKEIWVIKLQLFQDCASWVDMGYALYTVGFDGQNDASIIEHWTEA